MLSDDIINTTIALYTEFFGEGLSPPQSKLLEKVIRLAAKNDIALDKQRDDYFNIVLDAVCTLQPSISEGELQQQAERTWRQMDEKLREDSRIALAHHANDARQFTDDQIPLHQHDNKNNMWLINKYIEHLMPKETPQFVVLTPIMRNSLQTIELRNYLNNPRVESIVLPVGPGHWRLVHIKKEHSDDNPSLTVSIFDSFGQDSAKSITLNVTEWLHTQTTLPYKILYDAPEHPQHDGYSCGDFVIAKAHQLAQDANVTHEPAFVRALDSGRALRPLMIEKSKNPHTMLPPEPAEKWKTFKSTWESLIASGQEKATKLKEEHHTSPELEYKQGTRIIAYQANKHSVINIDENTQIELDEMLARKLQDKEYRSGPK